MRLSLRVQSVGLVANDQPLFGYNVTKLLIISVLAMASPALAQRTSPLSFSRNIDGVTPAQALNISTRMRVGTGDRVMIGGFILTGKDAKKVAIRGIGPSLGNSGLNDILVDPTLELRGSTGALLMQNDNWQDDPVQAVELASLGLGLQDPRESGIVVTLLPGAYTVVIAGKDLASGIGLLEVYDVDPAASRLANISTRGFVETGDNVMIGGFILGAGNSSSPVVVRGIGPSLSQLGLSDVLADPILELRDSNGALLTENDNWQGDPALVAQLTAHGLALPDPLESGIVTTLPPGAFTAILAGQNGGVGIGLIEVYSSLAPTTLTVTDTEDSGENSLRGKILAAIEGDTIQFDAALNGQIIALTSAELTIDKNLTIVGPGPDQLTVQRSDAFAIDLFRVFHVMPNRTVTIEGLTISNGYTDSGGGILSDHAVLTINNCTVKDNFVSKEGGGISNDGGSSALVTITNSSIFGNGAFSEESLLGPTVRGGGIFNRSGTLQINNSSLIGNGISSSGGSSLGGGLLNDSGIVEIVDSLIAENYSFPSYPDPHFHGSGSGIGIYNDVNGTLTIRRCVMNGNYTQDLPFNGYGGGLYNKGRAEIALSTISSNFPATNGGGIYNTGTIEITDSTIRQNSIRIGGGGVYNAGTVIITSSTLSDNTAINKLSGLGGGLVNLGALTINNSTLSGNHVDGGGGGIHNNGPLLITNSTLSDNYSYPNGVSGGGSIRNVEDGELQIGNSILNAGSTDSIFNNSARVTSRGYNLCSDDGGGFLHNTGDQINTNPVLGLLEDNGGPTFTHGLLTDSPAIDRGDPGFTPPPYTDQRGPGFDRVYGGRIDIGSFELQPAPPGSGRH